MGDSAVDSMILSGLWFKLGRFRANGYSVASRVSWIAIPALDVIFDMGWCVEPMRHISRAFISNISDINFYIEKSPNENV